MPKKDEVEVAIANSFSGKLKIERSTSPKVVVSVEVTIDLDRHKEVPELIVNGVNEIIEGAIKKELLPI
jgi:hypothetical protein